MRALSAPNVREHRHRGRNETGRHVRVRPGLWWARGYMNSLSEDYKKVGPRGRVLAQCVAVFIPVVSLVIQVVFRECRRRLFRAPVRRAAIQQNAYIVDL